jgi:hypothetical protein
MMNGVLELLLPKGEPTQARRIEIRAGLTVERRKLE